ncbi:hypothetical protein, partial [Escherichia coli]|uniref:hypothetical protein n=1 Tax=Escherichia coli TaxID=562 RepID=UPI0019656ADB
MTAEQLQNTTKITQLEEENSNATAANIAIGAVGLLLFWPALFALNTSDAPDVEIRALKERNANLD